MYVLKNSNANIAANIARPTSMAIEMLAETVLREFESIRNEMATQEDISAVQSTIRQSFETVGRQISGLTVKWDDEHSRIADRIRDLEAQLGFKKTES
jgi:hypothetical protein